MVAHPVKDLTGVMLGEYRVGALLGVGGMGAVYEGVHPLIGKRVAVKVLLPQLSADQELVNRFLSEARAVNEIRHRNIVDIFAFGQLPDGSHYFLMEYLEGTPFDQLIRETAPLPVNQALYWCEEVLEALGAAHEFGIIHRDVKPSNVFMIQPRSGRRYIKLLDFGIAKLAGGGAGFQTQASAMIGTPVYMSPEQARGRAVGPTTDLYALGCVLFELVTGRVVFPAENTNQVLFMHAEDAPPLAKSLNPLVPEALDELLQQLLKKDPAQRPQTAETVRMACELVRRQVSADTSFTQVASRSTTGEGLRPITGRTPQPSPSQAMDAALLRKRATPSPTQPPLENAIEDDAFGPTMVSSKSSQVPASPRPRTPWVLGAVTVLALAFAGWKAFAPAPELSPGPELLPAPPLTVAPQPVPSVAPQPVPSVAPQPAPSVAPAPVPSVAPPDEPDPKRKRISSEAIERRLSHLEQRLHRKEKETGDADGVLRQFLGQLRADAKAANTDEKRRAVWRNLDELKAQLDGR